ncbi:hypothetical protein ABGI61_05765 [Rheinheimera sp. FR7-31]|uniref:hypothetical protein n=1 Tax=Rheinheimera fenheensis TaxID=3152295 RepID=UPI00325E0EAC
MKKSNIFRPNSNSRLTFRNGWRRLSKAKKAISLLFLLLWCVMCVVASLSYDRSYLLILLVSGLSLFISYVTQTAKPTEQNDSLLAALAVNNGQLSIAGETLPANVTKLVLGKDPDRGIAFIQLAWNNGDEWQFAIEEYQAVAQYLAQNLPQLNVVHE